LPLKSKRLQLVISWVPGELEKRRFLHLTQHGQGICEVQYQILTTSGIVFLLQVPKVATFLQLVRFFSEKIHHVTTAELKQPIN
jgi:hypothetical protein